MKICVIGTSHAHCFRMAWGGISETHPDVSIDFFIYGGLFFNNFEADVSCKKLKMTNNKIREHFVQITNGKSEVNFRDYDVCLIVGAFLNTPLSSIDDEKSMILRLSNLDDKQIYAYSTQVQQRAYQDLFSSVHAARLFEKIRLVSSIPVYFFHDPFLTQVSENASPSATSPKPSDNYEKGIDALNKRVLEPRGAKLLKQPPETIATPMVTESRFGVSPRKPSQAEIDAGYVGDTIHDLKHKNPFFGRVCLEAFLKDISDS